MSVRTTTILVLSLACLVVADVLAVIAGAPASGLLVTVTDVTPTTARLLALSAGRDPVRLRVDPPPPSGATPAPMSPGEDGRAVAILHGLEPGRRYEYALTDGGAAVTGTFTTAPPPDAAAPVVLAWSGDLGGRGHCRSPGGWASVDAIARRAPDVFLFVGDTIYADHRCGGFVATSLDEFRAKHRENRADPAVQRLLRRTSVAAIWDDHEVRNNFAGVVTALAARGRQAFVEYWPMVNSREEPTRLYRALRWGRLLEIFILDTRSYRSANWIPDGPAKTMLGAAQRRWLLDAVSASTATWKVLVSSVSLSIPKAWPFGDSWAPRTALGYTTGFATERDELLAELRARGVRRLVALVGDVHFGAFMTHRPRPGLEVHELIAGPLAASLKAPMPPSGELNTEVHAAHGGMPTFGELVIEPGRLTARLFDGGGERLAEVSWAEAE